ncbi:CHAD domain-containing protein [bacterium]|nr:CHAD domain-containing protein [bacterium]
MEQPEPKFSEPGFPPVINLEADPKWDLGLFAQHTILRMFRAVLAQRQVVWDNVDVEGVHQIRVAARRCRTALQTLDSLWDEVKVEYFRDYLAGFADTFGVSRDLDVMVLYLQEQLAAASGERATALTWLLKRNQAKRAEEQPRLQQVLLRLEADHFPIDFVAYFARAPIDLWRLEVVDG